MNNSFFLYAMNLLQPSRIPWTASRTARTRGLQVERLCMLWKAKHVISQSSLTPRFYSWGLGICLKSCWVGSFYYPDNNMCWVDRNLLHPLTQKASWGYFYPDRCLSGWIPSLGFYWPRHGLHPNLNYITYCESKHNSLFCVAWWRPYAVWQDALQTGVKQSPFCLINRKEMNN